MDGGVVLVGDIGGTHARLARVVDGDLRDVDVLVNDRFPSFEALVRAWLAAHPAEGPLHAAFAIAAPITGDEVRWTNRPWSFSTLRLAEDLGTERLLVLNDFEAVAWALAGSAAEVVAPIGGGPALRPGPRVVLGPGTGLGVAGLVPVPEGWAVLATEGGHVGLSPVDVQEAGLLARVTGGARLEAEAVLSGPGLARLHTAMWRPAHPLAPETVMGSGLAGEPSARATLETFARLLARFTADAALAHGARGGAVLVGSIVGDLLPVLEAVGFREVFEDHPSPAMRAWLREVPTGVLRLPFSALHGCAAALGVPTRCT